MAEKCICNLLEKRQRVQPFAWTLLFFCCALTGGANVFFAGSWSIGAVLYVAVALMALIQLVRPMLATWSIIWAASALFCLWRVFEELAGAQPVWSRSGASLFFGVLLDVALVMLVVGLWFAKPPSLETKSPEVKA
jgi:hypothetical protein